MIMPMTSAFNN